MVDMICHKVYELLMSILNSFMQSSFVKIQDLIGYVCEYMLMRPKTTYKATYGCRLFVMIWMKIKLLLASANSIPGPIL
jgi:hypothetical protein